MSGCMPPVPGNQYQQQMVIMNEGTVTESSIEMGYEHDDQMLYSGSNFSALSQPDPSGYPNYFSVNSGFPTLAPSQDKVILVNFNTPTDLPSGTELYFYDTATYEAVATSWLDELHTLEQCQYAYSNSGEFL